MKTACSHCHKWFQVPDRALGKRAKCKACGEVFVVRPEGMDEVPMREVAPPPRMGSTARMRAVTETHVAEADPDDPLSALADAADSTLHDITDEHQRQARERESYLSHREHGEKGKPAPGAVPSLILGIFAVVPAVGTAVALLILLILSVGSAVAIALASTPGGVGGLLALFAIVQGNSARRRIRRSRGVLAGGKPAVIGMLLGWGALLVLGLVAAVALILLIRHGPIVSTTEKVVE